jgi:hypothetical protein
VNPYPRYKPQEDRFEQGGGKKSDCQLPHERGIDDRASELSAKN